MRGYPHHSLVAEIIRLGSIPNQHDLLQRATRMDFENYLAEDILVKVDRTSMLNSLEVRAPLLDHRLIEFAFRKVPSRLKATKHDKKILLKRLASKLLPPELNLVRKQGFSIPLAEWLKRGPFREIFWETLLNKDCLFDSGVVKQLLKNQDRGYANGERLFALVLFEFWRKQYSTNL
jgi:asparagine synthase (glutamine-hydrolysing)